MGQPDHKSLSEREFAFHMQEHKLLRTEIVEIIRDIRIIQRNIAVGLAAFLAWYYSDFVDREESYALFAVWIPFFVCVLFRINTDKRVEALFTTADYLQGVELRLANAEVMGWERYLAAGRRDDPEANISLTWDKRFWTFLILVSLVAGLGESSDWIIQLLKTVIPR